MNKKPSTYAKNPEQLARALGLNLSPRKRKGSLATVAGWIAEPSFPKKTSKGWVVAEIKQWSGGSARGDARPTEQELPKDPNGGVTDDSSLFDLSPEDAARAYRDRLAKNRMVYLGLAPSPDGRPLAKWEVEELRKNDLIPEIGARKPGGDAATGNHGQTVGGPAAVPGESDLCDTQADIARKLAAYYSDADGSNRLQFEIDQQAISDWKKGKRLPSGAPSPPGKCNSRQWSLKQWIEWFDRWLWLEWKRPDGGQSEAFGDADLRRMKIQDEREKILHEQFNRARERGQYIELTEHHRVADGIGMLLNRFISEHCEARLKKSVLAAVDEMGLSPEIMADLVVVIGDAARRAADGLRAALAGALNSLATDEHR